MALLATACGFHAATEPLTEAQAEALVHSEMKSRLWPEIQVTPNAQADAGWTAAAPLQALVNTLDEPTVAIVAGQAAADCALLRAGGPGAGPATARLASLVDASQPVPPPELEVEITDALENLRAFSANAEVDLLQFLEDPATGPDATIYENLPHYPVVREDMSLLAEALQQLGPGASPTTPAIVGLARQTAEDQIAFLLEFHAASLSTEADTILFLLTWLPTDPTRYDNLDNNGLPRFSWIAELNDLDLDEGNAAWAKWSTDSALATKIEADLAQLTSDLDTVQAAWRTQAVAVVDTSSPTATAAALCAQVAAISAAVSTRVAGSPAQPSAIGADLHSRVSDTFQLAQKSTDPEISGSPATISTK